MYVGFKDDPSRLGLNGENYWMYDSIDHDEVFESRNALIGGKARHCFLSFPSLKNPQASTHTAEIIAFVDPEPFVQWSSQPVKKRGQEYEHLKGRIADALLGFVDERIPGFRNLVEYVEVSTPLTTEHYTGHPGGTIYGIPGIPERYRMPWVGFRTPIPNLFMAGADTSVHGITGAMMSGAVTAGIAMGTLARVHAPLLASSLAGAALLLFVDVMKELPATFALRPFNFDTLAIDAYNLAKDERLAEAALPSLVIVAIGLAPLVWVSRRYFQATRS